MVRDRLAVPTGDRFTVQLIQQHVKHNVDHTVFFIVAAAAAAVVVAAAAIHSLSAYAALSE
jgi:signal transduction histidine kinase